MIFSMHQGANGIARLEQLACDNTSRFSGCAGDNDSGLDHEKFLSFRKSRNPAQVYGTESLHDATAS